MPYQFMRLEPFSLGNVQRILNEADRVEGFCSHVESPEKPQWWFGSTDAVATAVQKHMNTNTPIVNKKGQVRGRRRRSDHRCLVAGVVSWPVSMEVLRQPNTDRQCAKTLKAWIEASNLWLHSKFGGNLMGILTHADESHPHVHFFVVGDANLLHPGLRAEFVHGKRLPDRTEKKRRYRLSMKELLDEYHAQVGIKFGLDRSSGGIPLRRIKDRAIASRVLALEKRLEIANDIDGAKELSEIVENAQKRPRARMVF